MKKKRVLLWLLIILLVFFGIYVTILYFNSNSENNKNISINKNEYTVDTLPKDLEYTDNLLLYGEWKSEKIEVYRKNKLTATIMSSDKIIKIDNNDTMQVCYIDGDLICKTINYSFLENVVYVVSSDLYLSGKKDVILEDEYMILKSYINNIVTDYTLLYFVKK